MSNKIMLTQLGLNRTRFTAPQLAALPDEVLLRAAKLKDVAVTATQPYDDKTKREIADAGLVPWVPADSLKKEGSRLSSGFSGASGRGG